VDTVDTMRLLVRIVERRSFTAAAADLNLPRSTATDVIKQLEARLGVRLLQRTTRHVAPTFEGEAYYRRCVTILADIEDAESTFSARKPNGVLRIDVHGGMARHFILPHLPMFLAEYPDLTLNIGEGDRFVDLVREGVDCVVRTGQPASSDMIIRKLGEFEEVTVANTEYLNRYGIPNKLDDLDGHVMVGFLSSRTNEVLPLEFTDNGGVREITLPWRVSVTSSETYAALAKLGFGIVQAPRHRFQDDLSTNALVELLPQHRPTPTPFFALYPHNRQLSPRVRVFVDWLVKLFSRL
jgi:DNA-binding transcriptional LysR family regulator